MYPAERQAGLWQGVVAGFDGTSRATFAVRWAAAEASSRGCPLHVVRVVEHPTPTVAGGWVPVLVGPDETQRRHLEEELVGAVDLCRRHNPGLEVHAAMHDGPPCSRLAEHADLVDADVLAVGSSDVGPLARLVFGSRSSGLLRATRRTVVVVREPTPVQEACMATGYAPVVAVVDDVATGARVLEFAFEAAAHRDSTVLVVHADSPGVDQAVPLNVLRGQLDALCGRHPGVAVSAETVDYPARTVLDHSADARLVVVGDRRLGALRRLMAGAVSHTVLRHAACSVAVVP